jgi:integrase
MAVRKITHGRGTSYEMTAVADSGQVVRRRFSTRKQALDEYARLRAAVNDGSYIAAERSRMTFADYSVLWLGALQIRPSTMAQYSSNLHRHLIPAFGGSRLDRIDRRQVLSFVRTLSDSGLAPATVRGIVNLLRTILRSAVDDGRLAKSPCVRITLPELGPKRLAVFTDSQVASLVEAVHERHRAMLLLALGTGLRQGELLGVTTDALDLDAGTLHVTRQLLTPSGPGAPYLTPLLKTRASHRVLPLPQFAVDAVGQHLATYGTGQDGLLFPNPKGAGWRRGSVNDSVWKPLLQRAGLPSGFGMHALRHTYASSLITQNLHPKVIQERLGHASIVETMDTYSHLFPQSHAETAAALDRHYSDLSSPRGHLRAV